MSYNPNLDHPPIESNSISIGTVIDVVGQEIKDKHKVLQTFEKYDFVPYSANEHYSCDTLLSFFNKGRFTSRTLGACHNSIKSFALGGGLDISRTHDEFRFEDFEPNIPLAQKKDFRLFLKELGVSNYMHLSKCVYDEFMQNGNCILEVVHTNTGGVFASKIHFHKTETFRYWYTKKGEPKVGCISPSFDLDYLTKNPPNEIPLYPFYSEDKGVYRTLIHVKDDNFEWYGRPYWAANYLEVYSESKEKKYRINSVANAFTADVLIEFESGDIENSGTGSDKEFNKLGKDLVRKFTNKGGKNQSLLYTQRPHGTGPVFIHEFKKFTNEKYFKFSASDNRVPIMEGMQWSERLLGAAVSNGFSNDAFKDELTAKENSILGDIRETISTALNLAIGEAVRYQNKTNFNGFGISFKNLKWLEKDETIQS